MTSSIFITGTNTGVGKTIASALILSAAHSAQRQVSYFKPIQIGDESDCDLVKELTGVSENFINRPLFSLELPVSLAQAESYNRCVIDISIIASRWRSLSEGATIVEGCGGLLVPIGKNFLIRDLVKLLNLRLVIITNSILGSINHTLLTIEAALAADIPLLGIIIFGNNNLWLIDALREFSTIPILAEIPWLDSLHQHNLHQISADLLNKKLLAQFFDQ